MSRFNKIYPFRKLHQELIDEFKPVGALEEDIVADIARLTWRKQNLATFRIAALNSSRTTPE